MKKLIKTALLMAFVLALGSCKKESVESSVAEDSPEEFLEDVEDDAEEITEEKDVEKELPKVDMEYVMVNSPEGLNVRETPDLSSMKVAGLTDRTIVRLLQTGAEITIDGITSVRARIHPDNKESIKLCERLGMNYNHTKDEMLVYCCSTNVNKL